MFIVNLNLLLKNEKNIMTMENLLNTSLDLINLYQLVTLIFSNFCKMNSKIYSKLFLNKYLRDYR